MIKFIIFKKVYNKNYLIIKKVFIYIQLFDQVYISEINIGDAVKRGFIQVQAVSSQDYI